MRIADKKLLAETVMVPMSLLIVLHRKVIVVLLDSTHLGKHIAQSWGVVVHYHEAAFVWSVLVFFSVALKARLTWLLLRIFRSLHVLHGWELLQRNCDPVLVENGLQILSLRLRYVREVSMQVLHAIAHRGRLDVRVDDVDMLIRCELGPNVVHLIVDEFVHEEHVSEVYETVSFVGGSLGI